MPRIVILMPAGGAGMSGMNGRTGAPISGEAHIAQSIRDILTTPIGTRVMRRDYGSRLPELIDAPANAATALLLSAATAGALARWEPRVRLERVRVTRGADRMPIVEMQALRIDLPRPAAISLSIAL